MVRLENKKGLLVNSLEMLASRMEKWGCRMER